MKMYLINDQNLWLNFISSKLQNKKLSYIKQTSKNKEIFIKLHKDIRAWLA